MNSLTTILYNIGILIRIISRTIAIRVTSIIIILIPRLILVEMIIVTTLMIHRHRPMRRLLRLLVNSMTVLNYVMITGANQMSLRRQLHVGSKRIIKAKRIRHNLIHLINNRRQRSQRLIKVLRRTRDLIMVFITNERRTFKMQMMIVSLLMLNRDAIIRPPILRRIIKLIPRFDNSFFLSLINSNLRLLNINNVTDDLMYLDDHIDINPRVNKAVNTVRTLTKTAQLERKGNINVIANRQPPKPIGRTIIVIILIIIIIQLTLKDR